MQNASFLRRISALVLLTFTSLTLQPLQAVAQVKLAQTKATQTAPQGDDEQYAKLLDDIKETAKRGADKARKGQKTRDDAKTLRQQKRQLDSLETKVDDAFAATEADLIAKRLPPEILARHRAAVADYKAKQSEFKRQAKTLEDADDQENESTRATSIDSLSTWLEQNQKGKPHTRTDPNKLPFRTPDSKVRAPIESDAGFKSKQALFGVKNVHLAGAIPASGISFPKAALDPNAPPSAADLAPTEDVQITPAIQAKAQELGNHPVQIHNWVSNNIEFIPTYGSIQGSDMTLQTRRGNAFDTASLEIALLRAAGIPARYVYGTIQMPVDRVMNWVGGVTKPEAALNLLGQGGIPSVGLVTGGQISHIKMEHVWVSAYVDYIPSRGAVNRNPNTWVPLDASYKQYTYTQGMDIKGNVPLDANSLLTQAQAGATVNQAEGWVQNVNSANIQSALTGYQAQVKSYIDATKPNATVGDVLGSKTIQQKNYSILLGTLPYKTLAVGAKMAGLPDSIRHTVTIRLFDSDIGKALDHPVMELNIPLAKLGTRRLGVTYVAASPADQAIIDSYKAQGAKSLPAYLIHMKGQLKLDQQILAETPVGTMGTVQWWMARFYDPSGINSTDDDFKVESAIGDENVFGFNLAGLTETAVHTRQDSVPNDSAGETLHLTSLYYWAWQDARHDQLAKSQGIVNYRIPSVGLFAQQVHSTYFFGIPRSAYYLGRLMDIRRSITTLAAPDQTSSVKYMREIGLLDSYFEGATFDVIFGHELGTSASAVSLLFEANQQGIKIYQIDSGNAGSVLPRLQLDQSLKDDIANAVAAGLVVEAPEQNVQHGGLLGAGYIITDPATGSGTYLIRGGANGGQEDVCDGEKEPAPSPKPVPKLSWIQNLFFVIAVLALGAMVIPEMMGLILLLGAVGTANAGILEASVIQLEQSTKLTWDSTFGQVYGQWPREAAVSGQLPNVCGEQYTALYAAQKAACSLPSRCNGMKDCTEINTRAKNAKACITARLEVMTCYPGGAAGFGDVNHWNEVGNRMTGLQMCLCQGAINGCPPPF